MGFRVIAGTQKLTNTEATRMSFRTAIPPGLTAAIVAALASCSPAELTIPFVPSEPRPVPVGDTTVAQSVTRVFLWSPSTDVQVIPLPSHAGEMQAVDINNAGQVVGWVTLRDNSSYTRAFIWSKADGYREIGSLNGPDGVAMAASINDAGVVTGVSVGPEGILNAPMGIPMPHAFLWTAESGMKSLGNIAELISIGAVNAGGTVLGQSSAGTFFWNAATGVRLLPFPPGRTCSRPVDMNDKGQVLGYAGTGNNCLEFVSSFVWDTDGTQTPIENCELVQICGTTVRAMNNHAQVTGYRNGRAFRWIKEKGFSTIPIGDSNGEAINDNGDVAGGIWKDQAATPFVWMESGAVTTIQLPTGSRSGYAAAINEKGQVVGNFR